MAEIPEEIRDLLAQRRDARAAKDFARSDELRDQILAAGYVVRDTADGQTLDRAERFAAVDPAAIASTLDAPPSVAFSFHLLHEGFPADVERFIAGLGRHNDTAHVEVVVVDNGSADGAAIEEMTEAHGFARALHLDRVLGWGAARNAGLKTSRGGIIVLVDASIEPTGDILSPLRDAFGDAAVGVAGPFGLRSEDMRSWTESPGPEVDAIEGYLMAIRREALAKELVCEKFKWYRNADIDLSFQIRSYGLEARVIDLPVTKHTHRGWAALGEPERAKRSKRNHYIFFDRWKEHHGMLLSHRDH